jgi:hypothetical protein
MVNNLILTLTTADIKYKRFDVRASYKANPSFFPGLGNDFELRTNVGIIKTNVRRSTYRIGKGLKPWFRAHSHLKARSRIEFAKISPGVFRLH